jgi:hypothetical protein
MQLAATAPVMPAPTIAMRSLTALGGTATRALQFPFMAQLFNEGGRSCFIVALPDDERQLSRCPCHRPSNRLGSLELWDF